MADRDDTTGDASRVDDPEWIKGLVAKALIRAADDGEPAEPAAPAAPSGPPPMPVIPEIDGERSGIRPMPPVTTGPVAEPRAEASEASGVEPPRADVFADVAPRTSSTPSEPAPAPPEAPVDPFATSEPAGDPFTATEAPVDPFAATAAPADPFAGLEEPGEAAPVFDPRTGLPQGTAPAAAAEPSLTDRIGTVAPPPMPDLERALEADRVSSARSASMPDLGQVLPEERHRIEVMDPFRDVLEPEPEDDGSPDEIMVEEDATTEGFRSSDIRTVLEWLAVIVSALVVALVIKAFVLQAFWIPSESMETTVNKGDRILVNKISYRLHDVRRGDLVVFKKLPGTPGDTEDLIKRAIALPGETIEVRADGRIWIWGPGETPDDALLLEEPYLAPQNATLPAPSATDALSADIWDESCVNQPRTPGRCTLGEDQYFMMGDNRNASSDSRFFGPVTEDLIVGRAFLRIWPLGDLSSL